MPSSRLPLFPCFCRRQETGRGKRGVQVWCDPRWGKVLEDFLKAISKNSHLQVELRGNRSSRLELDSLEARRWLYWTALNFFPSVEGKDGVSRLLRGGGRWGTIFVTFAFVTSSKTKQSHPLSSPARGRKKKIKGFPPPKELIFSLNYESNGLGNSLYSVPDCLMPNKSFHVAPRVVAIRAHYRLIRALTSGIT